MAKKKKIDIKQVIADALEHYHKMKPSIKESTKRQNESLLSEFYRFVDTLRERERTMKIFSQKGLNRYKEYLIDKMERSKTDGKKRNFGVGQLNRCGSMIARLINNVLKPEEVVPNHVDWMKVEDTRREDQKGHFPLLDNEVTAIENCSGLTPAEEEYRDIFLLQIECGQRVSDLAKILTGKYRVKQGKKFKYIIISTIKENIKAHIPLRPKMRMWMEKVNSHKLITPVKFEKIVNGKGNGIYNQAIRRIVKKSGLDREIVRINSLLLEVRGPLYEEITNHAARCTFITNMLKKGVSTERLSKMTGHASDEMIKRVYAQLTEDDEINLIESDLYSDLEDNVADTPSDTSSKNPNELATYVHKEITTIPTSTDSGPSSISESDEVIAYENYIRKLNDRVDEDINEMNEPFQGWDDDDNNEYEKAFIDAILEENKQKFNSKEVFIFFWQVFFAKIKEYAGPDIPKNFLDSYRIDFCRILIDYLKNNHVHEDSIESLEEIFRTICEENPDAYFLSRVHSHLNTMWPIWVFYMVFSKMMLFIQENRPIADDTLFEDDGALFKLRIDWVLVFNELHKIPAMKLEALIQNINCDSDTKTVLFNSIKKGDVNTFYETIKKQEQNVRILIRHAYDTHYARKIIKLHEQAFNLGRTSPEIPIESLYRENEMLLLMNPYVDKGNNESIHRFMQTNVQEADININEQMLYVLDTSLRAFEDHYKYAYPSERKIFDKVRNLVDFNKYPKLKEAYDDYKAKQKTVSGLTDIEVKIVSEEDKVENRKKASSKVNYLPVSIQNLDIDKFIRLLTEKDKLNKYKQFITVLESTDNVNVATCLKHFLGTASNTPLSFTLKWNGNSMVSLKFLIRLIANTNEDAARDNVIKVTRKKSSDGISKNVSKWKGPGDLWTPVYNVFEGCTSSIHTAALGEEGTEPRVINLNELETIADIYFACKL